MAARLARSKATVVIDGVEHKGLSVVVRNNVATARAGTEVVAVGDPVASVAPAARHAWTVSFGDGSSWLVTDERRPCCGRRS